MPAGRLDTDRGPSLSYTAGPLAAGEALAFTLVAGPSSLPAAPGGAAPVRNAAAEMALGLVALAVGLVTFYLVLRSPVPGTPPAQVRPLVDSIAALDARFEAGELAETAYHQQRASLKAQHLRFYARMYDLDAAAARVDDLLERVGLAARRDDLVRTLSRGMHQWLALARPVLHRPQVLLLDEPYTGLDPQAAQALMDLLVELVGEGGTILLTTHNLERGLALGRRVVMLARGRVVCDRPRDSIDPATFGEAYEALATK